MSNEKDCQSRIRKQRKPKVPYFRLTAEERQELHNQACKPVDHNEIRDFIVELGESIKGSKQNSYKTIQMINNEAITEENLGED